MLVQPVIASRYAPAPVVPSFDSQLEADLPATAQTHANEFQPVAPTREKIVEQPEARAPTDASTLPIPAGPVQGEPPAVTRSLAVSDTRRPVSPPQTTAVPESRTAVRQSITGGNIQYAAKTEQRTSVLRQTDTPRDSILPKKNAPPSANIDNPQVHLEPEARAESADERPLSADILAVEPTVRAETLPQPAAESAAPRQELNPILSADENIRERVPIRVLVTPLKHQPERVARQNEHGKGRNQETRPTAAPEQVVHVTIGRIEVRATQPPAQATGATRPKQRGLSLDEYLRRYRGR
jgi:hypothetical protein